MNNNGMENSMGEMLSNTAFTKFDKIIKSQSDIRSYRALELTNKLKLLLISDHETDKSAACLAVRIGSFTDPRNLQGLAHFCEHMILLGSKEFPDENAYSKFINEHGGFSNAYTSSEETSFVFDVSSEHLASALTIFSALFVSPLFTESAVEREVNAVNSEHEKNFSNNLRRLIQLDKLLTSPTHDYSKFNTGNRKTLFDDPMLKNINVRDELIKFHSEYYSSNLMTVTILGKECLDEMEENFVPLFEKIENKDVPARTWTTSPWIDNFLQKKIYMWPIKEVHELHTFWPIEDYTSEYKSRPTAYLCHLLGHEAEGSLLSALKKLGLANELNAETYRPASGFACFLLRLTLTENGVGKIEEILMMIFQYISMIKSKGIQEWIFNEERDLDEISFRFKGKENPYQYVASLSSRMFLYPPEDVLTATHILSEFKPQLIEEILSCLVPEKLRCFIVSPKVGSKCILKEPYYGTKYYCSLFAEETIESWKQCALSPDFDLPSKNPYMPQDFNLRVLTDPHEVDNSAVPKLLKTEPGMRLWYKQDLEYKLPKAFINFNLISPFWCQDPVGGLIFSLFVSVFADSINEEVYLSGLAGMSFNMSASAPSIRLNFSGYNHKMHLFVEKVIHKLFTYRRPDKNRFNCLLEDLKHTVNNFVSRATYEQAGGHFYSVIYDHAWTFFERQAALKDISYERLVDFIPSFFNRVFVETLVYGNVLPNEAENYQTIMLTALKEKIGRTAPIGEVPMMPREVLLPNGKSFIYSQPNSQQQTSAILLYIQCTPLSVADNAMQNLFIQIISEPAFNKLRTEKQLGYVVFADCHRSNSMQGIRLIIQSNLHPKELDEHIEEFLAEIEDLLKLMTNEEFKRHVESAVSNLLEKPKKINQQNSRYWQEILRQRYGFNEYQIEAEHIRELSKNQLIEFYRSYIHALSDKRRKLAIYVIANAVAKSVAGPNDENVTIIQSASQFKRTYPLAGLAKPYVDLNNIENMPL